MKAEKFLSLLQGLALLFVFSACNPPASTEEAVEDKNHLGEITLEVTGAAEAQPHFLEGLLLLHSFEYEDARAAFQQAQSLDSSFVMAYWGEAMTHNHPLWRQQAYADARAALNRLAPTPAERYAKAGSDLERDFLEAAEILYGEGDKLERDEAYAKFMGKLYEKYPGNHEVAAFYALSQLGAVPVGQDEEAYERGAQIAAGILRENPNHPGALHYMIHSYDNPGHAGQARNAADSYAVVAPDAAHALHMPSHIYVALGMWDEVVSSNIDSWQASVNRMQRKDLGLDAQSYHAFHWLLYGYLQRGQQDSALTIMQDMARYTHASPSRGARSYLINMKGNYLVETGDWDGEVAGYGVEKMEDLNIVSRGIHYFTEGMEAFVKKDAQTLGEVINTLAGERENAKYLVGDRGVPMCSSAGANSSAPNQLDVDQTYVMEMELRGLEAWSRQDDAAAEKWLSQAADLQEQTSYDSGPPAIVMPSFELYGEWLLKQNRPQEAMAQFERALKRGPRRVNALKGQLQAAEMVGDKAKVAELKKTIDSIQKAGKEQLLSEL